MSQQERPVSEYEGVIDYLAIPAITFMPLETQMKLGILVIHEAEGEVTDETR